MRLQECFEDFLRDGSMYWAPSSYQYYKRNVDYFFNYLANRYGPVSYTHLDVYKRQVLFTMI